MINILIPIVAFAFLPVPQVESIPNLEVYPLQDLTQPVWIVADAPRIDLQAALHPGQGSVPILTPQASNQIQRHDAQELIEIIKDIDDPEDHDDYFLWKGNLMIHRKVR